MVTTPGPLAGSPTAAVPELGVYTLTRDDNGTIVRGELPHPDSDQVILVPAWLAELSELRNSEPRDLRTHRNAPWGPVDAYDGADSGHADGPRYFSEHGDREWWENGQRHRTDGPAIEYQGRTDLRGQREWWVRGQEVIPLDCDDSSLLELAAAGEQGLLALVLELVAADRQPTTDEDLRALIGAVRLAM